MDTRKTLRLHPAIFEKLKRQKATHDNITWDELVIHLMREHDEELVTMPLVSMPGDAGYIEIIGEDGERQGTPEQNATVLEALGMDGTVLVYVPKNGSGRPRGAKNIKPEKKRQKRMRLEVATR